jgi:SRSO17 transposase
MAVSVDGAAMRRLDQFIDGIGTILLNVKQRASFAIYALGLLGDGERKSIEPIAARYCADPEHVAAMEARLGHFLNDAKWSDALVRERAAHYAIGEMTKHEPVVNWIVDDTGMLKQGTHSVGVQRQYTGSAGKTTNCQVAVSLTIATRSAHVPIDFELYLPECWANDSKRRAEARIPKDVVFENKLELAIKMIRRAKDNGVPPGVVLVDSAYGNAHWFRMELRTLGLDYAVAVLPTTKVYKLDRLERTRGAATSIEALATKFASEGKFRRSTWRAGTRRALSARFAAVRVITAHEDQWSDLRDREALWLLMEWPDGESAPTKSYLSSLPATLTRKRLVRTIKERYRTERTYEDLKGEIGFDHYEGRRWPGWHHHASVALCCFAFLVAEHARRFPPSTRRAQADGSLTIAA